MLSQTILNQAQLLGVPRKGVYEVIPLGVTSRCLWAVFFVQEASEKCRCDCEGETEPVWGWVSCKQVHWNLASSRNHSQHVKPCSPELLKSFAYLAVVKLVWQRRQWHPTPILLPGKSHGRRSLVDCSPWGLEESNTTEQLHFHFSLSCIGEGNGNPLQCSCLENPRDGGAWAAVYGAAQSQTWLKWLSSSSSSSKLVWRWNSDQERWGPNMSSLLLYLGRWIL